VGRHYPNGYAGRNEQNQVSSHGFHPPNVRSTVSNLPVARLRRSADIYRARLCEVRFVGMSPGALRVR
jgi:hypothetical protein